MTLAFPLFKVDPTNEDYYVYLAFLLNQDAQCNIFTIAEALPPSLKR